MESQGAKKKQKTGQDDAVDDLSESDNELGEPSTVYHNLMQC